MSERKRGKMARVSVEEPSTPAPSSPGSTSELEEVVANPLDDKDMELERSLIRHNLEVIKKTGGSTEDVIIYLTKAMYGEGNTHDDDDVDERDHLIRELKDVFELEKELDDQKKASHHPDVAGLLETEADLRDGIERGITQFVRLSRKPDPRLKVSQIVEKIGNKQPRKAPVVLDE